MNAKIAVLAALLPGLGAGCSSPARAQSSAGSADYSGTLAAGDTVYVRNVNGNIDVVASKGDKVVVRAKTTGGATVKTVEHAGGITVCGIPKARRATCGPNGDLDVDGVNSGDSAAHLEIEVPARAVVDASTVNGELKLDAGNRARVATVNGSIEIEARGPIVGETVNGNITADLAKLTGKGAVELQTVNGSIRVTIPEHFDADVRAEVVQGAIETQRTLTDSRISRRELRGRLGKGGRRVALESVNGSITIR